MDYDHQVNSLPGRASLIWGLLIFAVGAGLLWGQRSEAPPQTTADFVTIAETSLTIHVGGWVAEPGLVEVPGGSRVADAIAAAGGALPGADLSALNLASVLIDGEQIVVSSPSGATTASHQADKGPIRLNSATAAELDELPGVGPVIAQRIVDFREANGPFGAVEDLLDVPGIGEAKLASLRDLVSP